MEKKIIIAGVLAGALLVATPVAFFLNKRTHNPLSPATSDKASQQFGAYFQHANDLYQKGEYEQAISFYVKAIKEKADVAQAYFNLGLTLQHLDRTAEAMSMYKNAVAVDRHYINPYLHIAELFRKQKNYATALAVVAEALKQDLRNEQTLLVKASILFDQGNLEQTHALCTEVLHGNPKMPSAYIMLGNVYEKLNKIPESMAAYKKAVELDPENPKAHAALADGYLALGDYPNWGKEYEWRWHMEIFKKRYAPLWNGSPLKDKKILLLPENGLGDVIQFVRFIPELKKQGAEVILFAQKPLAKLFSLCPYIDTVITKDDAMPTIDVMSNVASLPYHLGVTQQKLGKTPYLRADEKLVAQWKTQLSTDKNFKVGICWDSSPIDKQYSIPQSKRAMTLETIAKLAQTKNISLYSLQKDWPAEQLKKYGIKEFGPDFDGSHGSFMDTAAIMKNLDLVITIDTVTAHLAGALNVPVWVMLPVAADVRWMLKRADTPWYSSMKFFRQTKTGDWDSVIRMVHTELNKKVLAYQKTHTKTVTA